MAAQDVRLIGKNNLFKKPIGFTADHQALSNNLINHSNLSLIPDIPSNKRFSHIANKISSSIFREGERQKLEEATNHNDLIGQLLRKDSTNVERETEHFVKALGEKFYHPTGNGNVVYGKTAKSILNKPPVNGSDFIIPKNEVTTAVSDVAKGAGMGLAKTKTSTWHFRPSPVETVKGIIGPVDKLHTQLKAKGIVIKLDKTPLQAGHSGISGESRDWTVSKINSKNGKLAEKELVKSLKKRTIFGVNEQVVHSQGSETGNGKRVKGSRVTDVVQKNLARDIHEVKVGEVTFSKAKVQLAKDVEILEKANGFRSSWSKPAKFIGKIFRPVAFVMDSARLVDAAKNDHFKKTASEVAGGWSGALAGMAAGGAAGSAFFGIGAVPGAIIGGILGAFGGEWLGAKAYTSISGE